MGNISSSSESKASVPNWVQVVQAQVAAIRFGVVQITVHESRVVQVERTEKVRFDRLSGEALPVPAKPQTDGK